MAYEGPMKDFIQANDVVLKLGETDVNNLDDLQKAAKRVLPGKTQKWLFSEIRKKTESIY